MLEHSLSDIYTKLKITFYRRIFNRFAEREASLTAVETFCVEVIHALGKPTISEFADFVMVSQANATYKVQSLINKGYVLKEQSQTDRREYRLIVTEKFYQYYGMSQDYLFEVAGRVKAHFTAEELILLEKMMNTISQELMNEVELKSE